MINMLLWKARVSRGITLVELSKRTGISKSTLNNFENQRTYPNVFQLEKIATALDCNISDLYESDHK